MARTRRSPSRFIPLVALVIAGHCCLSFVLSPVPSPALPRGGRATRLTLRAKDDVVDVEVVALTRLEQDIEKQIQEAEAAEKPDKVRDLARLLVLTRASAAAAAWQATTELRDAVSTSVADSLSEFVGKEDYDINDVASKVEAKLTKAVETLDNVYLTPESAKSAPEGSTPIVLSEVVGPVTGQIKEGTKEAVLAFTGKEDYKFGDISKEAAIRAQNAIGNLLGNEEYQFGDLTKSAINKAKDAVTSFTGKEDYQFGDVTKTVLKNVLNWMEKDEKK
mmetsp:Transcript_6777/g.11916  ORF Transcript_6777/g.11916 Transcript_6777/m.11916 type:complete len:277 (+) Transcript_6777:75-905(+)